AVSEKLLPSPTPDTSALYLSSPQNNGTTILRQNGWPATGHRSTTCAQPLNGRSPRMGIRGLASLSQLQPYPYGRNCRLSMSRSTGWSARYRHLLDYREKIVAAKCSYMPRSVGFRCMQFLA